MADLLQREELWKAADLRCEWKTQTADKYRSILSRHAKHTALPIRIRTQLHAVQIRESTTEPQEHSAVWALNGER